MANDKICVFCGQKPGTFQRTSVNCAGTSQFACKDCEKEMKSLDEVEVCRRALARGLAYDPERLHNRIDLLTQAENHRPKCMRCGNNLLFTKVQELDNSPMRRDSIFSGCFTILPAVCTNCGKYEFYNPAVVRRNKYYAYLIDQDSKQ